ncbi:MAG TPA: efflux RND transporter periplasmic adaptor subunit [Gammaproteobacteria bacterium]|nr:efflux RND transporter periplasmic adaptor subunit [Gammaproteobacteria bacterium]
MGAITSGDRPGQGMRKQATRFKKQAFLCIPVYLLFALTLTSIHAAPGGRSAPVEVATAQRVLMAPRTWVAGTVISRNEARLAAEVAGTLVMVKDVGTRVKEGGVVARIDPTFSKLKIEELQAQVESDRARLQFLDSEVRRNQRLAKQNNAAQIRLEQVRADREVARNELRIARVRLRQAREELRRHSLRAPFDSVVAERFKHRGERVAVGDSVVRVVDPRSLEVRAQAPLATRDFIQEGEPLTLSVGGKQVSALVRALVTAGDDRSRLLDLRIQLDDGAWTVGQPVRVALPTAKPAMVLAVPRDALVLRRAGAFVFRIDADNKAQRVPVKLGVASGDLVAVNGALKPGDRVVVRGGERLRPGSVVKILGDDSQREK